MKLCSESQKKFCYRPKPEENCKQPMKNHSFPRKTLRTSGRSMATEARITNELGYFVPWQSTCTLPPHTHESSTTSFPSRDIRVSVFLHHRQPQSGANHLAERRDHRNCNGSERSRRRRGDG